MMLGAVLTKAWKGKAASIVKACQEYGVLVLTAGPGVCVVASFEYSR
ncbi:MAG: hypothetical protein CM1200mP30_16820 [Pseudomonadota bacterium]|nr:MAG: hypothetical protein CM1200mP30_16820 [Pseudomonadota bacterium]